MEKILQHIDDEEDVRIAVERLEKPEKRLTMEEAEIELGIEDFTG
jgi:hypothetical protein